MLWRLQGGQRYKAQEISLNNTFGHVCCVAYTYLTVVGFSFVGKQTCKLSHCLVLPLLSGELNETHVSMAWGDSNI